MININFKNENKKFHAIGFDMDHTFVRYKMNNILEIVNYSFMKYLIEEKNYPVKILYSNNEEKELMFNLCSKSYFDMKNSNFIKVDQNNEVLRAWNGFHQLNNNEIREVYGNSMKLSDEINLNVNNEKYISFIDQFEYTYVGILCKIIELRKENKYEVLNELTNEQLMKDKHGAHLSIVGYFGKKYIVSFKDFNYYFPQIIKSPEKYFYKSNPNFLEILKKLKDKGVFIFMLTNNHWECVDFFLKFTVGENYSDYFNLINVYSRKPRFWFEEQSFYNLDFNSELYLGKFTNLEDKIVKVKGNVEVLNKHLEKLYGKDFKVLYYGDSFSSDLSVLNYPTGKNWKVNYILEDCLELENGINYNEYSNFKKCWGSTLFDRNNKREIVETHLFNVANKKANRLISLLQGEKNTRYFEKILDNII